jgi:Cu(I)/Ag(I) efflux system membrane fusion protein
MEINTAAKFYNTAPGLEERRKKFESITELVWNLTRSIRFSGATIYYNFCPMAFDNKGAYWLSSERLIQNPYFGDKMLTCGQVMDSLNYSAPQ